MFCPRSLVSAGSRRNENGNRPTAMLARAQGLSERAKTASCEPLDFEPFDASTTPLTIPERDLPKPRWVHAMEIGTDNEGGFLDALNNPRLAW